MIIKIQMTLFTALLILSFAALEIKGQLIIEGTKTKGYNLFSKWQSLNDAKLVIEFLEPDNYLVYRDREKLLQFRFRIERSENGIFQISLYTGDRDPEPAAASIQIVNENRIRFYSWKHGNVLDTADEFFRTEDLDSFNRLIKHVMKEQE